MMNRSAAAIFDLEGGAMTGPWPSYLERYIGELKDLGAIQSAKVEEAFRRVPRHRFLEGFFRRSEDGWAKVECDPDRPTPDVLEVIYRNEPLVTRLRRIPSSSGTGEGTPAAREVPSSSTSQPGLVAHMLELLKLEPGMKVLEIGAGTGYNAALMAEVVGPAGSVISVDIDEDVVAHSRRLMEKTGYSQVRLLVRDGFYGAVEHAPYDRIVATVGCPELSPHWVDQMGEEGFMLVPLLFGGVYELTKVWREGRRLRGRLLGATGFVAMQGVLEKAEPSMGSSWADWKNARRFPAFEKLTYSQWMGFNDFVILSDRRARVQLSPYVIGLLDERLGVVGISFSSGEILLDGDMRLVEEIRKLYDEWLVAGKPERSDFELEFVRKSGAVVAPANSKGDRGRTWVIDCDHFHRVFRLRKKRGKSASS